jgi:hypothetical protein
MGCIVHGDAVVAVTEGKVRVLLPPHLDSIVLSFAVPDPRLEHLQPDPPTSSTYVSCRHSP